jgi:hypothetical protein
MADSIRISDETAIKTVEKYAKEKEIPASEAAASLIQTARGRLNALRKYALSHPRTPDKKAEAKPKPKKAKKPAAKKAKPVKKHVPVQDALPGLDAATAT